MNKITLLGNLGADPIIRTNSDGQRFATFRMATSDKWTDRETGEKKQRTEWHSVTVYNTGIVGVVDKFLKKGSRVLVEGSLRYTEAKDQNDVMRRYADVVLGARSILTMLDREIQTVAATETVDRQPETTDEEMPF